MSIHFTSDTHWGHANIIKYSKRPYRDVNEMNDTLIHNWNAVVQPNDTVYHLGDFAFMPFKQMTEVIRRLNGTKHMIHGNHDKSIVNNISALLGDPSLKIAWFGMDKEINVEGQMIVLHHYGKRVWNKSHGGSFSWKSTTTRKVCRCWSGCSVCTRARAV